MYVLVFLYNPGFNIVLYVSKLNPRYVQEKEIQTECDTLMCSLTLDTVESGHHIILNLDPYCLVFAYQVRRE